MSQYNYRPLLVWAALFLFPVVSMLVQGTPPALTMEAGKQYAIGFAALGTTLALLRGNMAFTAAMQRKEQAASLNQKKTHQ